MIYCNQIYWHFLDELRYEAVFMSLKCKQMVALLLVIILLFLVDN